MEIKEAIEWQEAFKKTYAPTSETALEACDMAINALKKLEQYEAQCLNDKTK